MDRQRLQRMTKLLCYPLLFTSYDGTIIAKTEAWDALCRVSEMQDEKASSLAAQAARDQQITRWKDGQIQLLLTPLEDDVVMVQMQSESFDHLTNRFEDTLRSNTTYQESLSNFGTQNCIATSDSMIRIFAKAKQVAVYPTTILLLGETGVGKEVVSSFIHNNSDRAKKPFIKINCSAIPEPLMEAELFGYEKGAFTGAREKGKMGLFELANHGTILLDEIGDMPLPLQTKLLRAIQENEILRVGGTHPISLDVRIIAATSRNMEDMVAKGQFLDALYYRLNVVELQIPPLRERQEDILPLAEFYLQHFCEKYRLRKEFSPQIRSCFLQYDWPGNVRELRNIVENLTVSSLGDNIGVEDLPARLARLGEQPVVPIPVAGESMKSAVESLQRSMIEKALASEGSLRKAAISLDMDVTTLSRLAKKLNITTH